MCAGRVGSIWSRLTWASLSYLRLSCSWDARRAAWSLTPSRGSRRLHAGPAGLIFVLALIGFGAKAGFVPFHVWLPEAHPAAPSHVSALMSGVMIKMGLYGLLRVVSFIGPPAPWWGLTLAALGLLTALVGISLALYQRDMKRVLAYSSIENMGLIGLALGRGLFGVGQRAMRASPCWACPPGCFTSGTTP